LANTFFQTPGTEVFLSEMEQHVPLSLVRPAWHYLKPEARTEEGELYQSSLLLALLEGVYEGETSFAELRLHGDFGLGTFNALDGEMVAFDGKFYQLRSDGSASPVKPEQKTPFAVVTFFKPEKELRIDKPMDKTDFLKLLEDATEPNLFSAIRVDGSFSEVRTRTVARQAKPYAKLTSATQSQAVASFTNVEGTLAGFRSPPFAQGLEVAGFHLHFLRQDGLAGGHALGYTIANVRVQIETLHSLHIELPQSGAFLKAQMDNPSVNQDIKSAEG
jgi:acetolactate decarboxylase